VLLLLSVLLSGLGNFLAVLFLFLRGFEEFYHSGAQVFRVGELGS
jgi:hypothetical protein